MQWPFRKPSPPPEPIYKRQPIATAAVMLTVIGMFVLGPIGALWNGMAEELKKKADNQTVIMLMQQQKENDDRQWEEIKNNRIQKSVTIMAAPKSLEDEKSIIPAEEFKNYINMSPQVRAEYKKYLELRGYDVRGLPE